jgi:hypothetical protein
MTLFSDTMYKVISFFVDIDEGHIDVHIGKSYRIKGTVQRDLRWAIWVQSKDDLLRIFFRNPSRQSLVSFAAYYVKSDIFCIKLVKIVPAVVHMYNTNYYNSSDK